MLKDVIRKTSDFEALIREENNGKTAKSILFISKDGLYTYEFCKQVACLIFDGKIDEQSNNNQKVNLNAHPDLKTYPQKEKLLVADSEDIVMESFIKPIFANKKIFIIKNIDEAMEVAQNKLLKILEEPPHNVYFLLTCSSVDKVLPTIRSRCNKIELKKIDDEIISQIMNKCDNLDSVIAVSDGQLGKAEMLAKKQNFSDLCRDCIAVLTKMNSSKQVLSYSKKLQSYKDDYLLIFEILSIALGDMLKIKANKRELVKFKSYENEFVSVCGEYTIRAICEICSLIDNVVKEKIYNVNTTLTLENFLLNILEVKYLCK